MEVNEASGAHGMLEAGTWRCMACTQPSNSIRVLPCEHKFCANCLRLWAMIYIDMYNGKDDEFPCQVCWKRYAVPLQGLQAFEQDYQIKVLQDNMAQMSMGQGHDLDQGQLGPFGYNAVLPSQTTNNVNESISNVAGRIPEDFGDYLQQPYNMPNGGDGAIETAQCMQMDNATTTPDERDQSPPIGSVFPSMVSHMAQQTLSGTREYQNVHDCTTQGPGYCMRSAHMHMHLI